MSADPGADARPRVTFRSRRLWRLRAARELPRYALLAVSVWGALASARLAIDPPASQPAGASAAPPRWDPAAAAFATAFARRYLTWEGSPSAATAQVEGASGTGLAGEGEQPTTPAGVAQRVEWAEVAQERSAGEGTRVYTVAAQTSASGLLYVTVAVARTAGGALTLVGYPALVGAPQSAPARPPRSGGEVADAQLATVVERALRNYLADLPTELAADLANGAQVSPPTLGLALEAVVKLAWVAGGGTVWAQVRAHDARGVRFTLAYELDVIRAQGRWEIAAVQTDPDA